MRSRQLLDEGARGTLPAELKLTRQLIKRISSVRAVCVPNRVIQRVGQHLEPIQGVGQDQHCMAARDQQRKKRERGRRRFCE